MSSILLTLIGLSGGLLVAGGMYALVTTLGVINRLAQDTHTAQDMLLYEECVIWGGTVGNIIFVFNVNVPLGIAGILLFGVVAGIYAGCLAVALAEVIKTFPVFIMRTNITKGFGWIILLLALGKGIGGLIYFFVFNY